MTLGQEFSTYAVMIEEDEARLREARALIQEINLGATAIGTGINAPAGYAELACKYLAEESGIPVVKARNLVEATQDTGAFVQLSGVLKRVATKLSKTFEVIGNDVTVTMASEAGQLQLNAFEPIMGWSLFKSITHLSNACLTLNTTCVAGIEANRELLAKRVREKKLTQPLRREK